MAAKYPEQKKDLPEAMSAAGVMPKLPSCPSCQYTPDDQGEKSDDALNHTRALHHFIECGDDGKKKEFHLQPKWPKCTVLVTDEQMYYNEAGLKHAEIMFLDAWERLLEEQIEQIEQQQAKIFINYSPCSVCAQKLSDFMTKNKDINLDIRVAKLYTKDHQYSKGLKLMEKNRIILRAMQLDDWVELIQRILKHHKMANLTDEDLKKYGFSKDNTKYESLKPILKERFGIPEKDLQKWFPFRENADKNLASEIANIKEKKENVQGLTHDFEVLSLATKPPVPLQRKGKNKR